VPTTTTGEHHLTTKGWVENKDFKQRLKEGREGEDMISIGIAFQTEGAEQLKASLPNYVRHLGIARR